MRPVPLNPAVSEVHGQVADQSAGIARRYMAPEASAD